MKAYEPLIRLPGDMPTYKGSFIEGLYEEYYLPISPESHLNTCRDIK